MTEHKRLGKYEIIEEIGRGGFATVYRALDTTLGREVALKVLNPLLLQDPTWARRFHREAKAVARLQHSHIVTIYEIGEEQGQLFIAMELVKGPSLRDLITERGRLTWDQALYILAQVATALDYAHKEGIVHRDLKPGNILVDPRRGALLTDFGLARLVGESSMSASISGGVVGTPSYIAPEIWDENVAEVPADIYALGCIVYEMVTGDVLFEGATPLQSMRAHDRGPQFPARWPEGVPKELDRILTRALACEPEDRFASAGEMAEALKQTKEVPMPHSRSFPGKWIAGISAAAVVVALLVCGLVKGCGLTTITPKPTPTTPVPTSTTPTHTVTHTQVAPTPTYTPTHTPVAPTPTHTPTHTPVAPTPTHTVTHTPVPPTPTHTPTPQYTWADYLYFDLVASREDYRLVHGWYQTLANRGSIPCPSQDYAVHRPSYVIPAESVALRSIYDRYLAAIGMVDGTGDEIGPLDRIQLLCSEGKIISQQDMDLEMQKLAEAGPIFDALIEEIQEHR